MKSWWPRYEWRRRAVIGMFNGYIGFSVIVTALALVLSMNSNFRHMVMFLHVVNFPPVDFTAPRALGMPCARHVTLQGSAGRIQLWHILPSTSRPCDEHGDEFYDAALMQRNHTVVLFHHGNGGNIAGHYRVQLYHMLTSTLDCHVVTFDYRGFGKSEGHPSEDGVVEDAHTVYHWLTVTKGVSPRRIVLHGHSMGAAIATHVGATLMSRFGHELPAGLILQNPFVSFADVTLRHPVAWFTHIVPYLTDFLESQLQPVFASRRNIANVTCPIIIFHGTLDFVVPFWHGEQLYHAAMRGASEHVRFVSIRGGLHNNLHTYRLYASELERFLCDVGSPAAHCAGWKPAIPPGDELLWED